MNNHIRDRLLNLISWIVLLIGLFIFAVTTGSEIVDGNDQYHKEQDWGK